MTNKKGFTIVELVIVIAVIAILAAVLIPTFSSVISKANASAAQSACKNALEIVLAQENPNSTAYGKTDYMLVKGEYYCTYVAGGSIDAATKGTAPTSGYTKLVLADTEATAELGKLGVEVYSKATSGTTTTTTTPAG